MDVFSACNAVLEVQSVFVGVQVVFGYDYLPAARHGHGDFVALDGYYVENNGMFAIEKLKLFEIKLSHIVPPQSTNLYQMEYSISISRFSYPVLSPLDVFFSNSISRIS